MITKQNYQITDLYITGYQPKIRCKWMILGANKA